MAGPATVRINILGDASSTIKATEDTAGGFSKLNQSVSGFAKVAAGALAGSKVVDFLKDSINAASDLNETVSKSNQIFGTSSAAILKWSRTSATAFGLSQQAALENAASFGNMFQQLGVGQQQSTKLSKSMVELAADFASFHNADITQVLEAQQAAFRGEYDALQRFVPTINAAAVQQKAMAMTGKDNAAALTDQEKAMAAYQLMIEGAGKAQGDFARTSDGAANQQRILAAEWENAKAKLGTAFLPVLQQLLPVITDLVQAFSELPAPLQAAFVVIGGGAATFGPVISGLGDLSKAAASLISGDGGLGKMAAFLSAGGPWLAVGALAVGAIVGITQAFADQQIQLDLNIAQFEKLSNQSLVALIQKLKDAGETFGDSTVLNRAFNEVLAESPVQAQRWIDAAAAAGINTEGWTKKLQNHQKDLKQTADDTEAAKKKVDSYNESLKNVPPRISTTVEFHAEGSAAAAAAIGGPVFGGPRTMLTASPLALAGGLAAPPAPTARTATAPVVININTTGLGADAPQIQRAVVDALRGFTRRNGPLDIPVRSN